MRQCRPNAKSAGPPQEMAQSLCPTRTLGSRWHVMSDLVTTNQDEPGDVEVGIKTIWVRDLLLRSRE
jgi:hypothetical protein